MRNVKMIETIDTAGVGRENPQGLETVVSRERATALCARFGPDVNEHARSESFADNFMRAFDCGNWAAYAVNRVTANQHNRSPIPYLAFPHAEFGNLGFLHVQDISDGA
jgi:hypothetical protein